MIATNLCAVHLDLFAVRILNGRVILLDEDVLDELHRQSRFPHATRAQDDDLVIFHAVVAVVCFLNFGKRFYYFDCTIGNEK